MSSELSEAQNVLLGATASFVQAVILQPTIYWKNAAQQGLKFTWDPRVVYRGLGAALVNECGQMGFQFGATGVFKKLLGSGTANDLLAPVLGGAAIGPFAQICELTMIQQQRFGGTLAQTPIRIFREYGFQGIMRGLSVTIIRDAIYVGALLGSTPVLQDVLEKQGMNQYVAETVSGGISGAVAGVVTCPLDACNTVMKGDLGREIYGGPIETFQKRVNGGIGMVFGGVFWRTFNIMGTIIIANAVRIRIQPYMEEFNRGRSSNLN